MAEVIFVISSIVSIVASSANYAQNARRLSEKVKNAKVELRRQVSEVEPLLHILQDCADVVSKETYVPESVDGALKICLETHRDLMEMMEKLQRAELEMTKGVKRWLASYKLIQLEASRKRAFDGFRESVLLLQDLTSSLRSDQRLLHISAAMAQLMAEWNTSDTEGGNRQEIVNNDSEAVAAQPSHSAPELRKGPGKGAALQELAKLIESNFTRDITLVLDAGGDIYAHRFKYIPVRAKMDTGCDENLISRDVLERVVSSSVLDSLLIPVKQGCEIEFEGVEKALFTPEYEITLTWYQDRQMKSRKEKFYIVTDAPFDVNIGSKRLARDFSSPALALMGRKKKKAEKERELQNREKQLKEAERLEREQILAAQLRRAQTQQSLVAADAEPTPKAEASETSVTPNGNNDDTAAANKITSE